MRLKSLIFLPFELLLLGALVSSCSQSQDASAPAVNTTPSFAQSEASGTQESSSPTTTPQPPMPSATVAPSKTPSPLPSPTPTSFPTLTKNERESVVLELLKTHGNCTPPCFWGIVPGKTTLDEALEFFKHLGQEGMLEMNREGEVYHYANGTSAKDDNLYMSIELAIEQGIITRIQVLIGGFFYPVVEPVDWEAYNLGNILKTYGVPSRVVFSVEYPHEPGQEEGKVLYSYWLFFEDSNLMVFYPGSLIGDASYYQVCPLSPAEEPSHMYMIFGEEPAPTFEGWVDLVEASQLTNEDFYQLYTEGDEHTCISLRREPFLEPK